MKKIVITALFAILLAGTPALSANGDAKDTGTPSDTKGSATADEKVSAPAAAAGGDAQKQGTAEGTKPGASEGKDQAPPAKPGAAEDRPKPKGFDAAVKLYSQKKWAPASAEFQKFVKANVDDLNTHAYLAYCLYNMRKYSQAVKEFDWVSAHSQHSVTLGNSAENSSRTLKCMMRGICPGDCLKASDPGWSHPKDLDPHKLWKKFGEHQYYSNLHIGDVIKLQNGEYKDVGKCPLCGGTGTVAILRDGDPLPH